MFFNIFKKQPERSSLSSSIKEEKLDMSLLKIDENLAMLSKIVKDKKVPARLKKKGQPRKL